MRPDNPEKVIRSETSREINSQTIQPHHTVQRHIGSVTVDNLKNGRYQGELQIVRHPLSAHDNVNVVAQIIKEDLPLLNCIAPNDTFNFQKLGVSKVMENSTTEARNEATMHLDEMTVEEALITMNEEEQQVPLAVKQVIPQLTKVVNKTISQYKKVGV